MYRPIQTAIAASCCAFIASCGGGAGNNETAPSAGDRAMAETAAVSWVDCAAQDQTCAYGGTREVRYGANGAYVYKTLTGPVACSNAVFGDPLPGVAKTCSYAGEGASPPSQQAWRLIDLGTLGGEATSAAAINDAGSIVGTSQLPDGAWRAFLYQNGGMTDLGTLGGNSSAAAAINQSGQIIGTSTTSSGASRAFVHAGDGMSEIVLPFSTSYVQGRRINDSGDMLVEYVQASSDRGCDVFPGCAYLVRQNNSLDLAGAFYQARDLNNDGQIAATATQRYASTLIYRDGSATPIGALPGPAFPYATEPSDMNNKGEVVGYSGYGRPFIYRNGHIADINTLVTGDITSLSALNDNGDLVGTLGREGNRSVFLYNNKELIDLNSLPAVKAANWTLQEVTAINNAQQIIGHGINQEGKRRAFLLMPG